jgi:hypothetical protein
MNLSRLKELICMAFFEIAAAADPPCPDEFAGLTIGDTMKFAGGPDFWPDFYWDAFVTKLKGETVAHGRILVRFDVEFLKAWADKTWGEIASELYHKHLHKLITSD